MLVFTPKHTLMHYELLLPFRTFSAYTHEARARPPLPWEPEHRDAKTEEVLSLLARRGTDCRSNDTGGTRERQRRDVELDKEGKKLKIYRLSKSGTLIFILV